MSGLVDFLDFNSTEVRLRVPQRHPKETHETNFNSTEVRLRGFTGLHIGDYLGHFNSTEVRLRVAIIEQSMVSLLSFQFH